MALLRDPHGAARCSRCSDSKLVQNASGDWIRCAWCRTPSDIELEADAEYDYELARLEARAERDESTTFAGAREDWGASRR